MILAHSHFISLNLSARLAVWNHNAGPVQIQARPRNVLFVHRGRETRAVFTVEISAIGSTCRMNRSQSDQNISVAFRERANADLAAPTSNSVCVSLPLSVPSHLSLSIMSRPLCNTPSSLKHSCTARVVSQGQSWNNLSPQMLEASNIWLWTLMANEETCLQNDKSMNGNGFLLWVNVLGTNDAGRLTGKLTRLPRHTAIKQCCWLTVHQVQWTSHRCSSVRRNSLLLFFWCRFQRFCLMTAGQWKCWSASTTGSPTSPVPSPSTPRRVWVAVTQHHEREARRRSVDLPHSY